MITTRPWLKPGFRLESSWVARFDDQAERLVTLGMTNQIALWDVALRKRIGTGPTLSHASHAEFSADGASVVAKNTSGEIVVFDSASLEELSRFAGDGYGEGTSVRFSSCGRFLIDGSWGGRLLVRDADTGSVVWEEAGADGAIFDMRCTRDRTFWVYRRWKETAHPFLVRTWPFLGSPDGRAIAHAGYRFAHVYDFELSTSFSIPLRWACHANFSPSGDRIAFGDQSAGFVMPWPLVATSDSAEAGRNC